MLSEFSCISPTPPESTGDTNFLLDGSAERAAHQIEIEANVQLQREIYQRTKKPPSLRRRLMARIYDSPLDTGNKR